MSRTRTSEPDPGRIVTIVPYFLKGAPSRQPEVGCRVRVLAFTLRIIGFTLLLSCLPAGLLAWGLFRIEGLSFLVLLAPVFIIAIGALLLLSGRQLAARRIGATQMVAGQPTVLYLRSFGADATPVRTTARAAIEILSVTRVVTGLLEGWATEEEQLADALEPVGKLVAIGRPGERLPLPGATRVYVGDEWQQVVESMMAAARLTVIRLGTSPGVLWEIERARRVLAPERLLILLPSNLGRTNYEKFREHAQSLLRTSLPPWSEIRTNARRTLYGQSGYVHFLPGGVARFAPVHAPPRNSRGFKPYRQMLRYSLQPVYQALRVPWTPTRHIGGCLGALIIVLIALVALVMLIAGAYYLTSGFR